LCGSKKYLYSYHRGSLEIPKAKTFKGMYEPKLELPGGWGGGSNRKPPVGEAWIFSGKTHWLEHLTGV